MINHSSGCLDNHIFARHPRFGYAVNLENRRILDDIRELPFKFFDLPNEATSLMIFFSDGFEGVFEELTIADEHLFNNFEVIIVEDVAPSGKLCSCIIMGRFRVVSLNAYLFNFHMIYTNQNI